MATSPNPKPEAPETTPDAQDVKTKEPAPTLAQVQAAIVEPVVVSRELKIGDEVRLSAVYGRIVHPYEHTNYDTDQSHKVIVDSWTKIQFEAGKLKIEV